jgi:hypothetical protein
VSAEHGAVARSARDAREADAAPRLRPLSEHILAVLPGPRALWIAVWALIPWLNAGANLLLDTGERSAVWEQSRAVVIVNYAALSFAMVVTLLGAEHIARRAATLEATTAKVLRGVPPQAFREMNSVRGPVVAAAVTALAFAVSAAVRDGSTPALLRGATWVFLGTAMWTFLWAYASLQLGLNRLGRAQVRREAALADPELGLRPSAASRSRACGCCSHGSFRSSSPACPTSSGLRSGCSSSPAAWAHSSFRSTGCTDRWSR